MTVQQSLVKFWDRIFQFVKQNLFLKFLTNEIKIFPLGFIRGCFRVAYISTVCWCKHCLRGYHYYLRVRVIHKWWDLNVRMYLQTTHWQFHSMMIDWGSVLVCVCISLKYWSKSNFWFHMKVSIFNQTLTSKKKWKCRYLMTLGSSIVTRYQSLSCPSNVK